MLSGGCVAAPAQESEALLCPCSASCLVIGVWSLAAFGALVLLRHSNEDLRCRVKPAPKETLSLGSRVCTVSLKLFYFGFFSSFNNYKYT